MQAGLWITLFRRIPTTQHDNLVVVTSNGTEVMVQKIVRLEEDFVILRGRLSGSTDQGRVMMIPYEELNYLAFNKALLEKEILAIFGTMTADGEFADVKIDAGSAAPDELAEVDVDEEEEEEEAPQPTAKPKPPSKSILLARLRERLAGGDGNTR